MSNKRRQLRQSAQTFKKSPHQVQTHSVCHRTNERAGEHRKDKITTENKRPIIVVLELIGTLAGGAFASLFGSTGHIIACIWCVWVAVFSGLGLIYNFIGKSEPQWTCKLRWICGGVIIGVTIWFSFWSYTILHVRNTPLNAEWQPPELPKETKFVFLSLGGNGPTLTYKISPFKGRTNLPPAISFAHDQHPIRPYLKDNRFFVDVDIPAPIVGTVEVCGDKVSQIPPRWDCNKNSNDVEIVNGDNHPIYQISYKQPDNIRITGVFASGDGMFVSYGSARLSITLTNPSPDELGLKPIFKYPSRIHPGEYANTTE